MGEEIWRRSREMIAEKITDIQNNYEEYYEAFKANVPFNGPSLHFHSRALELRKMALCKNSSNEQKKHFLEMIYATLVSWGMHSRAANMVDFDVFEKSIIDIWVNVLKAQEYTLQNMDVEKWGVVENIYKKITIMSGNSHLVGNSKVIAHLLPDIVAPIDRRYTLSYLHGNKNTPKEGNKQFDWFKHITNDFYHKVFEGDNANRLGEFCNKLVNDNIGWDTSGLKIIDNLVIGARTKEAK